MWFLMILAANWIETDYYLVRFITAISDENTTETVTSNNTVIISNGDNRILCVTRLPFTARPTNSLGEDQRSSSEFALLWIFSQRLLTSSIYIFTGTASDLLENIVYWSVAKRTNSTNLGAARGTRCSMSSSIGTGVAFKQLISWP